MPSILLSHHDAPTIGVWARLRVAALTVAMASASACLLGAPLSPIGVTTNDGQLEVLASGCDVAVLSLILEDGTRGSPEAEEVWHVRAPLDAVDAPRVRRFVVGTLPAGFEEVTALKRDDGKELYVTVNGQYQMSFDRDDLEEGQVLTQEGLLSPDEFFDVYAPHACRTRGQQATEDPQSQLPTP